MSHSLSNQLVNRKKKLSLGKADTYLMSEMSLKHSWTLQIKILSKDILAYAIYLAETYINGIRSKTVPRQQESFYVQTQELHHPKVLRHLTLIWTGEGKKGKRRKGKEKKIQVSIWDVHGRQVGEGMSNYWEIQTDFFHNRISPSFKITIIRKWIKKYIFFNHPNSYFTKY